MSCIVVVKNKGIYTWIEWDYGIYDGSWLGKL